VGDTLQQIFGRIRTSRDGVLPGLQAFPSLDVDSIARSLELSERGAADGKRDCPATNDQSRTATELSIEAEIANRARQAHETYLSQLNLYDGRIMKAITGIDNVAAIEAAGRAAIADFDVQAIDDLNHLHLLKVSVVERMADIKAFRAANNLIRLPNQISPRETIVRLLVLAIFLVLETAINGSFFAEGSAAGLIGGIVEAAILSALNIAVALGFGKYGCPQLIHVSPLRKAIGVFSLLAFGIWVIVFNLFIAHFRDAFIASQAKVLPEMILNDMLAAPLQLGDTQSLILAVLGMVISIGAAINSFHLSDPYPGYGEKGRLYDAALSQYAYRKSRCLAGLTGRRDVALTDMAAVITETKGAAWDLQLAIAGRARLHELLVAYLSHLQAAAEQLRRRYYESNIASRSTSAPERFSSFGGRFPELEPPTLPPLPAVTADERPVVELTMRLIREVNDKFSEMLLRYQTLSDLAADGSVASVNA
jgi:hypothetical protein